METFKKIKTTIILELTTKDVADLYERIYTEKEMMNTSFENAEEMRKWNRLVDITRKKFDKIFEKNGKNNL